MYGQKKKAARRAVDRARRSMEEELYRKLDEDGGKKMIFNMARDRTEDGRDVKRGAVIKDNKGRLITESKEVLRIWAANFKELLNGKGAASCLDSRARLGERRKWRRYDRKKWKQQCTRWKTQGDRGRWSAARDVGDGWRGWSQVDRKATERVYAGGKDTERMEDGPDSADMEEERGCACPRKVQGHYWRGF